ncbi:midnolin-like [Centroberyx affinis]|uniref:midnolin-like n=1 Tax=Centroberyx affinis TaxID=166261 RepID=UPI003A5C61B0
MEQQQQQRPCSLTPGRAAACGAVLSGQPAMRLSVTSTTGSEAELSVPRAETVEGLKTRLSQKLRLPTDRMVLLHKDRQLDAGKLLDLGVADESKLTLVPTIEAGLTCQTTRTDRPMMQALESLTEAQISDFLSGRSPLTVTLGIGTHMMYVELQLAAQNAVGQQQHRAGLSETISMTHPGSASTRSPTNTSPPSQTLAPAPHSPIQLSTQRPRTSFNLTAPTSHLSNRIPVICHQQRSSPAHSIHTSSPVLSTHSLPSGCPLPGSPHHPAAPVSSPRPTCSSPGPHSPAPASTFPESNGQSLPTDKQQPGAVIESFVNHSPGVFSGTFSGTLAPVSQTSISHPRRGITIILQILNDLLRATCHHQGAPPTLPQPSCSAPGLPVSPLLTTEEQLVTQRTESLRFTKDTGVEGFPQQSSTEENQTLRCKLEQLQVLMHQRRLRRRTRSGTDPSQTSHPYQHHHHHPWSPGRRRTAHRHSNGSLPISEGGSPDDLKLQVAEEPPWKPELTSDLVVV